MIGSLIRLLACRWFSYTVYDICTVTSVSSRIKYVYALSSCIVRFKGSMEYI